MALRWLLLTTILSSIHSFSYMEQRFAMEPQNQTAIVGSRVTLPCRVINKSGVLQWTKDDFGLGPHRNLTGYERYKMIGSDEEGKQEPKVKIRLSAVDEYTYWSSRAKRKVPGEERRRHCDIQTGAGENGKSMKRVNGQKDSRNFWKCWTSWMLSWPNGTSLGFLIRDLSNWLLLFDSSSFPVTGILWEMSSLLGWRRNKSTASHAATWLF